MADAGPIEKKNPACRLKRLRSAGYHPAAEARGPIEACGLEPMGLFPSGMDHHVYFWLKEEYRNDVDRAIFEQGLSALFDIGLVAGGRWAVPAKVVVRPVIDQSWDYALTMQFKNIEDHDAYQVDPDHHVFISTFKDWWAQVQVKDLA